MAILLDYSAGQLTGGAVAAGGAVGVIRYAGTPGRTKNTTPGEVASMHAAGRQVHGVFENRTGDFLGGYVAGVSNARALLSDANNCGIDGALFMSADQHLTSSDIPTWVSYVQGAGSVLGARLGVYGFSEAIGAANMLAQYFWQCGAHPLTTGTAGFVNAWQRNSGTTTVSVGGIQCDISDILIPIGADMPLTNDDANVVWSLPLWQHFNAGSQEAAYAVSVGYTANADGSVDIRNATAGQWLTVAAFRIAEIETQIKTVLAAVAPATIDYPALAAAIVAAGGVTASTTLDPATLTAVGAAAVAAVRAQFEK